MLFISRALVEIWLKNFQKPINVHYFSPFLISKQVCGLVCFCFCLLILRSVVKMCYLCWGIHKRPFITDDKSSGLSYKDREERVRQLREKQQLEKQQKLEELKEQVSLFWPLVKSPFLIYVSRLLASHPSATPCCIICQHESLAMQILI